MFLIADIILGLIGFNLILTINLSLKISETGGSFNKISFSEYKLFIWLDVFSKVLSNNLQKIGIEH